MDRRLLWKLLPIPLLAAVGLGGLVLMTLLARQDPSGDAANQIASPNLAIGGPFSLVDHQGRPVTEASYDNTYRLMYFGYSFCPDLCPTELQTMAQVMDLLGPDAGRVTPILVTVDPDRDTVEQLRDYVGLFHPALVGLTGSTEQIAAALKAWRIYAAKAANPSDPQNYAMDHSTYVYLMGPDNHLLTLFKRATPPAEMAAAIRKIMAGRS